MAPDVDRPPDVELSTGGKFAGVVIHRFVIGSIKRRGVRIVLC